jgi:pilus assembly protein Flp/PilA
MFNAIARSPLTRNIFVGPVIEGKPGKESSIMVFFKNLLKLNSDERGVTALEYGMIAALIAVVVVGGFTTLGTHLSTVVSTINASI